MAKRLTWSKVVPGEYHGRLIDSDEVVAVCVKTGSHLDDYPWDWYLTDPGVRLVPDAPAGCTFGEKCTHNPKLHERRHAGVEDTLRAAKLSVEATLAPPGDALEAA